MLWVGLIDDADVGIPWPVDVPINKKFWAVLILKIKGYLSNRHSILSPKYKKGGFLHFP